MVGQASPPSPKSRDFIAAFLVGGLVCLFGQALFDTFSLLELDSKESRAAVSVSLIFIAAVLTGLGVFDRIAKLAGAGTLIPITGFANAIVSPAIEYKNEGWVLGLGAKMFTIAGPVIVYGTVASTIYGLFYWCCKMLF